MSVKASESHDFTSSKMKDVFIGISGLIGAGKSTLARSLADRLQLPVHLEPVADNEYLEDFYGDIAKYSFPMQVYLLNRRFQQQQQIIWQGAGGVQDRTIYEDSVFARMLRNAGLMDERDYQTYVSLFNNMSNFMKKPNIIVHLDVSPEESLRRIRLRERECESGITLEYLTGLHAAYEEFISEIARQIPVIKVNYSQFRTADEMAEKIAEEYERIANIRHVDFPGRTTEDAKKEPEAGAGKPPASPGAGEKPTTAVSSPAEGASVSKPVDICASPVTAPL